MKIKLIAGVGLVLSAFAASIVAGPVTAASQPRNCNSNSILYCGAYSKAEFMNKVNNGDGKHTAANIQHIYYNEGRGITAANFLSSDTVDGVVYRDGRVVVNGKVVATAAWSIGREWEPGAVRSGSVWSHATNSFLSDSIPAYVNMQGGVQRYFILKSCGNAGYGTPVAAPKPNPTPVKTATPLPNPVKTTTPTPVAPTPTPVKSVTPTPVAPTPTPVKSVTPTPVAPTPTPIKSVTPIPVAPVTADELPATGPESALAGLGGLTAIGYATSAYVRSRRGLTDALRRK